MRRKEVVPAYDPSLTTLILLPHNTVQPSNHHTVVLHQNVARGFLGKPNGNSTSHSSMVYPRSEIV